MFVMTPMRNLTNKKKKKKKKKKPGSYVNGN
jgi:hypothetical protein